MKKLFILFVPVIAALSSCVTTSKTAKTVDISASIRNASVADLDVAPQRVTYTMTPSKAVRRGGLANIKRVAESEALEKNGGGDVIVNPEFTVTKRRGLFGSKVTSVTVSGRPATYKNVRSLPDSVWCNPIFRGVPQYVSTRSNSVVPRSKQEKEEPAYVVTPRKKWTNMVRVGVGMNRFSISSDFDKEMESHVGFSISYEANRSIGTKGFYYGLDLAYASRGYKLDENSFSFNRSQEEKEKVFDRLQHTLQVTPLILGWKLNLSEKWALDPHFGVYLSCDPKTQDALYSSKFDSGWKLGIGIWFKHKIGLDFTYQGSFINTDVYQSYDVRGQNYDNYNRSYSRLGRTSNSMFRLTYAF